MPGPVNEAKFSELVKNFQVHRHSKTCRKYRNNQCKFHFGKFFSSSRIAAEPLPSDMSEEIKIEMLKNHNALLSKVNTELNLSKKNYDSSSNHYEKVKSIDEILGLLEISKVEYEAALSISEDKDFQLHFKRPPKLCFVNNYFSNGVLSWEANLDIQPVLNHYKALAYMHSYLSNSEKTISK